MAGVASCAAPSRFFDGWRAQRSRQEPVQERHDLRGGRVRTDKHEPSTMAQRTVPRLHRDLFIIRQRTNDELNRVLLAWLVSTLKIAHDS